MTPMPPTASALSLAHPDRGVREEAARALVAEGSASSAASVAALIAHPDIAIRNLAGDVLVRLGAVAVEPLAAYLDDEDPDVRKFAVDVLARLPAEPLTGRIAALLDDEDANVRLAAIDALAELGAEPFAERLVALYHAEPLARASVIAALGTCDAPEASALVVAALSDDDPVVHLAAAAALAELDVDALPLLADALARETGAARAVVLDAFVRWGDAHGAALPEDVEDDLLAMLNDPDADYRCSAARGFGRLPVWTDPAGVLAAAGDDDALDVALFEALLTRPAPFEALQSARLAMAAAPAASFAVALIARGRIPADRLADASAFLEARYDELDADTKLAVLTLSARLGHPELAGVLRRGLGDADPMIASATADAAETAGFALGPIAPSLPL